MPVGNTRATRSPGSIPSACMPPQAARARSRISAQPNQVAVSARSTKRSPPSGRRPARSSQSRIPSDISGISGIELPPHDGDQIAHRLDSRLVSLVEEDAKTVFHLGRQGEEANGIEPQVLDQAQVRSDDAIPAEMSPGHLLDSRQN